MSKVKVEKLSEEEIEEKGIRDWPIWEKEKSTFDWNYGSREQCLILQGKATVEPAGGDEVKFSEGDFVTFPAGMDCVWEIHEDIKKHYKLG
ncbi:MAG: cupin domain-containing protein [Elusimicrobiota bacterium]